MKARAVLAGAFAALVGFGGLAACGDDADPQPAPATDGRSLAELTEGDDLDAIRGVFGDALGRLGLDITRGGLSEIGDGDHLALYVEPMGVAAGAAAQDYLDRLLPSVQAVLPLVFEAFPELDSFDLCQEPFDDPSSEPTPVTIVLMTRQGYESVDEWDAATLADLLTATDDQLGGHLAASAAVESLPDYRAAVEAAAPEGG